MSPLSRFIERGMVAVDPALDAAADEEHRPGFHRDRCALALLGDAPAELGERNRISVRLSFPCAAKVVVERL